MLSCNPRARTVFGSPVKFLFYVHIPTFTAFNNTCHVTIFSVIIGYCGGFSLCTKKVAHRLESFTIKFFRCHSFLRAFAHPCFHGHSQSPILEFIGSVSCCNPSNKYNGRLYGSTLAGKNPVSRPNIYLQLTHI